MNKKLIYILLLVGIVLLFLARMYDRFPGDLQTTLLLQEIKSSAFSSFMKTISSITQGYPILAYGLVIALMMFLLRRKKEFFMSLGMLVVLHLTPILKIIAGRPRPSPELVENFLDFKGLSFPSGHAFQVIVLFGFLIYLAEKLVRVIWLRRTIQISSITLIVLVGLSRIYLGAHWLSDILAGYYFGGLFLLILIVFWDKIQRVIDSRIKLKYFNKKDNR